MEDSLDTIEALRVDLATLRRRGIDRHTVRVALPAAWLADALKETDAEVSDPGKIELELLLQPEGVVVARGPLCVRFSVPCGRCLGPASVDGGTQIFATFMPGPSERDHEEIDEEDLEPDGDSPDVWRYEGGTLALAGLVAEQVALGYPMRALCERADACRGLCSNCGYELNTAPSQAAVCPGCNNEVPLTPVADLPGDSSVSGDDSAAGQQREGRELASNPLADALRKLKLD